MHVPKNTQTTNVKVTLSPQAAFTHRVIRDGSNIHVQIYN